MKIDKRIISAINYNVKEILIKEETYNNLDQETKIMLKQHKIKLIFDESQKDFLCKFK